MQDQVRAHPTADISPEARIGAGTSVWHHAQVREGARIGSHCVLSKGVYVDAGVVIGDNVKIQNYVSLYRGVTIEDGVFCGPHCVFTNDKAPRAVNADGSLQTADDWEAAPTRVMKGASIGANAVIVCGVTIGAWAMIGAGSVVTHDVPDHGLVWGNPARLHGFVCPCGRKLEGEARTGGPGENVLLRCRACGAETEVPNEDWERVR
jgi:acetyltransferase-like isoleucine patch superfamily enzyme